MQHIENEEIIKSYDPVIMRRILEYLKPYRLFIALSLAALAFSTAAELLTPIVLKIAIDREILVRYSRIKETPDSEEMIAAIVKNDKDSIYHGGFLYFHHDRLRKLNASALKNLEDTGLLDRTEWFAAPLSDQLSAIIDERFIVSDTHVILRKDQLSTFTAEDLAILREDNIRNVLRLGLLYLLLLASTLLFSFFQVYLMASVGQKVMKDIRLSLFRHVLSQSLSFLGKTPVGTLVTRVTNDVETINEFFTSVSTSLLKDTVIMTGVLATLFLLDFRLALITMASFPPVIIGTIVFRRKAREAYRRVRHCISQINAFLSEHISGMDVVQMFSREKISRKAFTMHSDELLQAGLAEMYVFAVFRPLVSFFTSASIAIIIYFGSAMVLDSHLSLGVLIAYINLTSMFYRPVMNIAEQFTVLQSAMAGGERIFSLLDKDDRIPDTGVLPLPSPLSGSIDFKNVCFSYREDESVIRNLSFSIKPGETVAIVGYTGAGKTTISNLLTRLWDIQSGEILLDGIDIRAVPLAQLRRAVQPVQQDVFLFAGTIEENISFGGMLSRDSVISAAKLVQADKFINLLSDGYSTVLAERGSNLSTGERQLLSFARVLAQNPRVIILDEATGSVDTETEHLIQDGIKSLMKGRTSLVIAHRLSTIRSADRILVLSGGKLAEEGTHEELIKRGGIYYNLYKLQFEQRDV
jgi:ATP-binding cassette, subfamily B, multidrug efflux pump